MTAMRMAVPHFREAVPEPTYPAGPQPKHLSSPGWQNEPRQRHARPHQHRCPHRMEADGCLVSLLVQVLDHQEAAQVTRAREACPLRLGWKKSRVLTWLALNW
jgi:hypothetical protein